MREPIKCNQEEISSDVLRELGFKFVRTDSHKPYSWRTDHEYYIFKDMIFNEHFSLNNIRAEFSLENKTVVISHYSGDLNSTYSVKSIMYIKNIDELRRVDYLLSFNRFEPQIF